MERVKTINCNILFIQKKRLRTMESLWLFDGSLPKRCMYWIVWSLMNQKWMCPISAEIGPGRSNQLCFTWIVDTIQIYLWPMHDADGIIVGFIGHSNVNKFFFFCQFRLHLVPRLITCNLWLNSFRVNIALCISRLGLRTFSGFEIKIYIPKICCLLSMSRKDMFCTYSLIHLLPACQ